MSHLSTAWRGRSNWRSFKIALKLRRPAWEQKQPHKQWPTPSLCVPALARQYTRAWLCLGHCACSAELYAFAYQIGSSTGFLCDSDSSLEGTWPQSHMGHMAPTQRPCGAISSLPFVLPSQLSCIAFPHVLPTRVPAPRPSGHK